MLNKNQLEQMKTCMKYDRCSKCPHYEMTCLTDYSRNEMRELVLEYHAENELLRAREADHLETIEILVNMKGSK